MNVLFDLDGTLINPQEGITRCIAFALQGLGVEVPPLENLLWCIGPPLHHSFAKLVGEDRALEGVRLYRERYAVTGIFEHHLYDGVEEMLRAVRDSGARIFLATSKFRVYAKQILDHFNLSSYFTAIYGSEFDGTRSDKAELIAYAISQSQLDPAKCLMVGDREYDVIGAFKNQMKCVGVMWGYGSHQELTAAKASKIINHPRELLSCLV